jgi:hypothetical protein
MLVLLFATIIEGALVWYGYLAWFRPRQYMEWTIRARSRASEIFPFVMRLWTVRQITKNGQIDLWWARLVILMVFVFCTIGWLTALAEVLRGLQ